MDYLSLALDITNPLLMTRDQLDQQSLNPTNTVTNSLHALATIKNNLTKCETNQDQEMLRLLYCYESYTTILLLFYTIL